MKGDRRIITKESEKGDAMKNEELKRVFQDVFAPKSDDNILFLIDIPHDTIQDTSAWKDRREMAYEWYGMFKELGSKTHFSVDWHEYNATGLHNSPISSELLAMIRKYTLVIAMTEYSASSSLLSLCKTRRNITRGASMPGIERRMEQTALTANYKDVKRYANAISKMLTEAIGAKIVFSTHDELYIDLRNRVAEADTGDCTQPGQFINFPSGEACIAPYEAAQHERRTFGPSKTKGILPVSVQGEVVKWIIQHNKIIDAKGSSTKAQEMRRFLKENDTRRNIAELGIGCNPKAVITGNVLEDEKVGLHIAYGMSTHLGGTVTSDMHEDICYSKGCPVEGTTVTLLNTDGTTTALIQDAMLQYYMLQ